MSLKMTLKWLSLRCLTMVMSNLLNLLLLQVMQKDSEKNMSIKKLLK